MRAFRFLLPLLAVLVIASPSTAEQAVISFIDIDGNTSMLFTEVEPGGVRELRAVSDEAACIAAMNVERAKYGVPPLVSNTKLTTAARGHSTDMATNNFFDHVGTGGSTLATRLQAVTYNYLDAGENIAAGYGSAQATVNGWMASTQGHREAILNPNFWEVGVGYAYNAASLYGDYWTADFGRTALSPTPGPVIPVPAPTWPPGTALIDLTPNKYSFSTTDFISVTADVWPIAVPFVPYIRVIFPSGKTLYYVKDAGFTSAVSPYLPGPYTLSSAISGYPVLQANFSITETGNYTLQGYAVDTGGTLLGAIDSETLAVQ